MDVPQAAAPSGVLRDALAPVDVAAPGAAWLPGVERWVIPPDG